MARRRFEGEYVRRHVSEPVRGPEAATRRLCEMMDRWAGECPLGEDLIDAMGVLVRRRLRPSKKNRSRA